MAFITVYSLIIPAVAFDRSTAAQTAGTDAGSGYQLACTYEVHKHTKDCYEKQPVYDADGKQTGTEKVLICGKEDYVGHEHDENCYETVDKTITENGKQKTVAEKKLVCTLPEIKEHKHTKECYAEEKVLTCGKTEQEAHKHSDKCYKEKKTLDCGKEEHRHSEKCYAEVVVSSERVLQCGYQEGQEISPAVYSDPVVDDETGEVIEEVQLIQEAVVHHHDDSCYQTVEKTEKQLTCGLTEHTHSDKCYKTSKELVCGKEETKGHKHSKSCYGKEKVLTCGKLELHTHTIDCYEKGPKNESPEKMGWVHYEKDADGNKILVGDPKHLICGKTELLAHQHDADCWVTEEEAAEIAEAKEAAAKEETAEEAADTKDAAVEKDPVAEEIKTGTDVPTDASAKSSAADKGEEAADAGSGASVLISESDSYTVTIKYDENANIPEDAEIDIKEIPEASRQYQSYMSEAEKLLIGDANGENGAKAENGEKASGSTAINYAKIVDVNIVSATEGTVTPEADIDVDIAYKETEEIAEGTVMQALSFNGRTPEVEKDALVYGGETHVDGLQVTTDQLPVYAIVGTEILSTQVITANGETYTIEVTYGPEAGIPEGAELYAKEIVDPEKYDGYLLQAEDALSNENDDVSISYARFFDIEIRVNGEKTEPKAPVEVRIINSISPNIETEETMSIVHFADEGTEIINDLSISEDGKEITYSQDGFSVTGEVAGTFSGNNWPSTESGQYVLVVYSGNGAPYYAVNSSGGLVEVEYNSETGRVTFPDNVAPTTDDLDDYWWTYYVSGGNHRLTSVANTNNKIYPVQTEGGSALSNSTNSPAANQGYIYRGNTSNRYCVAINNAGTSLMSTKVSYGWTTGYTYPSNAAHFIFVNNFEEDGTGAYGIAQSTILSGNSKTLRMAEVTTADEDLIDFDGFTWRSANTSIATVSTDPDTDAPIATAVAVGTTKIIGTRTNADGKVDEVVWTVTVKDKTNNSIVFLHQPQDNANFANQDNIRPHDGYGNTEPTNYVKFVVALADENGNILLYNGKPNVELPEGSIVPERYEFELDSTGVLAIEEDTLSGISVPGYSYAGTYAYFGWYNNTDLENMAVVSQFKNMGAISSRYPNYYSVLGFMTSRGNPQYQDYSQTAFGNAGYGYYAYNPTGVLMLVLQPVSENIAYRTSYHNDYVPGGVARTNIIDTTRAKMTRGEWIPDQYRWDWYGETIMTTKTGTDLISPADGYEFVGWFDAVDAEGNGTGNQIVGQTEEGYYYALRDGEKIVIRQNNDFYAKWQLVRGTITINKEIIGDLSDAELSQLKEALSFTITDDTTEVAITKTGSDITWNQKNGTVDVSGLSAATTYTVTESNADVTNYEVTTVITDGTNIKVSKTGAKTVSITNTYVKKVATIKVIKMESGTSTKLANASFNLYRPATDDDAEVQMIKVNGTDTPVVFVQGVSVGSEGEVEVVNLPLGSYYLVETEPPVGYELLTTVIGFEVSGEAIKLRTNDHVRANGLELTVFNDSGVSLPNTGGSGTLIYTLSGIALMLSAAIMYGFRMRRRERRLN